MYDFKKGLWKSVKMALIFGLTMLSIYLMQHPEISTLKLVDLIEKLLPGTSSITIGAAIVLLLNYLKNK